MAADDSKKTQIFYIKMGGGAADIGSFKYAWKGKAGSYDGIKEGLGVQIAKDTEKGLVYGSNNPKPVEVTITYKKGNGFAKATRFCSPEKLNDVLTNGSLNGKKIKVGGKEYDVSNVTLSSN